MENLKAGTVVIGGGPGGYAAAIRLGQLGVDTILVEKNSLGGTCLNVGCIPSKALLHASFEYYKLINESAKIGISVNQPSIDWGKTIQWKSDVVTKIVAGVAFLLKKNNVRVVNGHGKLESPTSVSVDSKYRIEADNILLATGSKVMNIPNFPVNHTTIIDSTDLLELKSVPNDMVILGAGIIGMELGNVYAALGCRVTIIEMMDKALANYDDESVRLVTSSFKKMGGDIILGSKAVGYEEKDGRITVIYEKKGETSRIEADKLAVTVGRVPNIDSLGLEEAGVLMQKNRIIVNNQFQSSVPTIYAVGDLIDGPMLAHKATAEGVLTAEGIAGEKISRVDIKSIPDVVYTKPEIAKDGLMEKEATEKNIEVITGKFPLAALGRTATTIEQVGFIKYVAEKESKIIIGALVVSTKASELISEAALAVEMGATLDDVALTIPPHPTFSEGHMEAAAAGLKKAIHIIN